MGNLFGKSKKKESRITEQDRAVLQLKQQRDKLKQYQKKIQIQLGKERELAKRLIKEGKKNKALLLLKKKRFQENMIEKTDGQLENIERLTQDIEFAQVEAQVVEGLKVGNESLKKMHEMMSIEDVERIMEETQDSVEYQQEIDAILAGGLTQQDEADVEAELDAIIKDSMPELPAGAQKIEDLELPEVPEDKIKEKEPERTERTAVLAS